jgi:hypothetical protein
MSAEPRSPLSVLRAAIAIVAVFAIAGTVWLVDKAVLNPEVRAKKPGWFEGVFNMPFWLPLILTFVIGAAAVIAVYVKAARRIRAGEDLHAQSFRQRTWDVLQERKRLADGSPPATPGAPPAAR